MNNSIKKELEAAKIAADKCMDEKCSNSPKFKKFTEFDDIYSYFHHYFLQHLSLFSHLDE
jgi:hypothetical protein